MDPLTKFIVYNKTPESRTSLNYEAMRAKKRGRIAIGEEFDKRFLLLSPDLEKMYEGKLLQP